MKDLVISILGEPTTCRIRFEVGCGAPVVAVSHLGFARVASAINAGTVRVELSTTVPPGRAVCATRSRTLELSANDPVTERSLRTDLATKATVVHECVHAYVHLAAANSPLLIDETAAFLAQTMYRLLAGDKAFESQAKSGNGAAAAIFRECVKIVSTWLSPPATRTALSKAELDPLFKAPVAHPGYEDAAAAYPI